MRRFLKPYRLPLGISASLAAADTILGLARPWPLSLAVDHAINHRPLVGWMAPLAGTGPGGLAAIAAGAAVGLVALGGITGYLTSYLSGAAAERIGADLRATVYQRLLTLSPSFHDRNRSGDLVTRLTGDVSRVQDALVAWLVGALPDVLTLVGLLIVMLAIDPVMTVVALVVVPPLTALAIVRRRQIKAAQREARARQGDLASRAAEALRHVRAVQAFAQQEAERGRFGVANTGALRAALRALDLEARYSPAADLLLAAGSGLVLWLGVTRVTSGRMSLGVLLVVLAYLSSMYRPVRSLTRLSAVLAKGAASRERLSELLDSTEYVREAPDAVPAPEHPETVTVTDLRFGYDDTREHQVLRGVDLTIRRGELVCLVGQTGVGKSTLLSLLLRLYDPHGGSIRLDGADIRTFTTASLRERIALVPQDPWILDGTIADNIAFGRPGAGRDEIVDVARTALVHPFVEALPAGYDTVVGEGGVMLSGGQRRRIALARALLRGSDVLLLDEPTSGLDARSEHAVMAAIERAAEGRMALVVSHRLQVATLADRVLVMTDGLIDEAGTPAELVARGGTFADWCRLQNVDVHRSARELVSTNGGR
jgi:ABC-type multidrug transport system fused ATPase/permease subunit